MSLYKIVILGEGGVGKFFFFTIHKTQKLLLGKSCITIQLVKDYFLTAYDPTIGV
jgi:GTPase SAR1 family protein